MAGAAAGLTCLAMMPATCRPGGGSRALPPWYSLDAGHQHWSTYHVVDGEVGLQGSRLPSMLLPSQGACLHVLGSGVYNCWAYRVGDVAVGQSLKDDGGICTFEVAPSPLFWNKEATKACAQHIADRHCRKHSSVAVAQHT